jgi:hypothetical protein
MPVPRKSDFRDVMDRLPAPFLLLFKGDFTIFKKNPGQL